MKFQIVRSPIGARQYFWRIVAQDGRMLTFSSELYETRDACLAGIEEVQREAGAASVEDLTEAR